MTSKAAVNRIIETLKGIYPDGLCSLQYKKDYELLFAVRLSAQCTDERVNKVTPALYALFSKKVTPAGGMAGILVGGLVTIIWTLMGTPYGIQCAIVAVPASVIAILIVSAVTRCNDPKRSLEALYQDN